MSENPKEIYLKTKAKGFTPKHVCEVGVYVPQTSNILDFIQQGVKTTLVEADPGIVQKIKDFFGEPAHITLHPVAVYDEEGTIEMVQRNASTFIGVLPKSPALVNDAYELAEQDKYTVATKKFSQMDDGSIDLLSVDIEGAEWYVVKHLVSRPTVISLETHGKYYLNPYLKEISDWMQANQYQIWFKDKSDTVYIRKGAFEISLSERLGLFFTDVYLSLRRNKKFWKK